MFIEGILLHKCGRVAWRLEGFTLFFSLGGNVVWWAIVRKAWRGIFFIILFFLVHKKHLARRSEMQCFPHPVARFLIRWQTACVGVGACVSAPNKQKRRGHEVGKGNTKCMRQGTGGEEEQSTRTKSRQERKKKNEPVCPPQKIATCACRN